MSVDVIGPIYQRSDHVLGEDLPAPVRLWGFHVNVTADVLAGMPALQSSVKTPAIYHCVWSGDDPTSPIETIALRFNGENAAREALGELWPADHA